MRRQSRLGLLGALLLAVCGGAAAQRTRLQPIKPADVGRLQARLDRSLLQDGTRNVQIDAKQSFDLKAVDGTIFLTLMSVAFQVPHGAVVGRYCGVFLLQRDAPETFFNPVPDDLPVVCEDIAAVRLRRDNLIPPTFMFTADFTTGARAFRKTFEISWDAAAKKYTLDAPDF
jgi:hypothetical protein